MANKTISARFQCKNDTSENWAKATTFVPLKGEIIYYNDLQKFKMGDGTTLLSKLNFHEDNYATVEELEKKYSKPSAGIPQTDLASAVQTKLNNSNKEAYLEWGGRNLSNELSPIDAALDTPSGANRLAFCKPEAVKYEYSRDGGETWVENTDNLDSYKRMLFSSQPSTFYKFVIGNSFETGIDKSNYMFRITLDPYLTTVYTILNKFILYIGTGGSTGCYCSVEYKSQKNYAAGNDTWNTLVEKATLNGNTGKNVLNITPLTTFGGSYDEQAREIRFVFGVTRHPSTVTQLGLYVQNIAGYGGAGWKGLSNLSHYGTLYTLDYNQNATFPAGITATKFNGRLDASNLTNCSEYTSAEITSAWNS